MKILFLVFLLQISLTASVFAQSPPFAALDKQLAEQTGGWSGNKADLSKTFQEERKNLGDKFETELRKYLGDNVEKHYWIASFLDGKSYLHGSEPLPDLALEIRENALKLLRNKADEKSVGTRFSFAVATAVAAEKAGNRELAANYKTEANSLIGAGIDLSVYFPALSQYERCLYQNVGQSSSPCFEQSAEKTVSAGVVNSKALILSKPVLSKEVKKKKIYGEVQVKVLIDEQGKVVSAEAIKGPEELRQFAVDAALGSRFTPTLLSGNFVKVTGVIVYNF